MEKPVVKQAHGLTPDEMEDLRVHQINDTVPMIPANNAGEDQIKDPYFRDKYKNHMIPEVEKNHYHVVTEARLFNSQAATPEKMSNDVLHVFTKEAFKFQMDNKAFNGMQVHILHNPTLPGVDNPAGNEPGEESNSELAKLSMAELKQEYLKITGEDMPTTIKTKKDAIIKIQEAQKAQDIDKE